MLKRVLRALFISLLILAGALFVYAGRYQIAAKLWHWRHGYSVRFGGYEIPVPDHWLVETSGNPDWITLTDTRVRKRRDPFDGNSIDVHILSNPLRGLDFWLALKRHELKDIAGLPEIQEKALNAGDEKIVCLGGYEIREATHVPTTLVSLDCRSTGQLSLMFVGHQTQEFYAIASQIRKAR